MKDSNKKLAKMRRLFSPYAEQEKANAVAEDVDIAKEDVKETVDVDIEGDGEFADHSGGEYDELTDEMQWLYFLQNEPEVMELIQCYHDFENKVAGCMMQEDFEKIKAVYPDVTETSVAQFGPDYCSLVALNYDPITAYEAVRAKIARETKNPPPNIGAVNNTSGEDKDFYTPEEVDKLTRGDFKRNPRLLEVVRRSMTKWNN